MYPPLWLVSTILSSFFFLFLPFRIVKLNKETVKLTPGYHGYGKLVGDAIVPTPVRWWLTPTQIIVIMLSIVQSVILGSGIISTTQLNTNIYSEVSSWIAYIGLCPLLFLEHRRSIKPSDLAVIYLLASFACDLARLAALTSEKSISPSIALIAARGFLKFTLFLSESRGKEHLLRDDSSRWSPEQLAGVLSRAFFWWINPILARGNRRVLISDDLPPTDRELSSKWRRYCALRAWDQRGNL